LSETAICLFYLRTPDSSYGELFERKLIDVLTSNPNYEVLFNFFGYFFSENG